MQEDQKLSFCRIAWKIAGAEGHGDWHDASQEKTLQAHVDHQNAQYGFGSHRIEYDNGDKSSKTTMDIINKITDKPSETLEM